MDVDIAIVGGGPAGVATALFFAAAAPRLIDRIVVLEKERYPREKICAGAVGARADRLLDRIGVRVDVPSAPVRGFSVLTSRGLLRERASSPVGRVVRRVEFDRAFADVARARGVRILEGARVTEIAFDDGGVRLDTSIGELRARAVVGADGVGSFVRRAVGMPRGRWLAQVVEVDTPAIDADPSRDFLHFDLTDDSLPGYVWDFPTVVDGEPLVCRGIYALRPDPSIPGAPPPISDAPDVGARLVDRLSRLGVGGGRVKRFAERGLALNDAVARPRALLVGEAAGIDPALGEGIAQAIFYGATAGPYLAGCLDRGELSFAGWRSALMQSRVGLDLRIRTRLTPWLYGWLRPLAERWVAGSRDLAIAGMRYFAGERVPRRRIAGAALALGGAAAREWIEASVVRPKFRQDFGPRR
ncbi:putative oxidoreductase [Minicystis rosea]|nr:putative oxidoreductase [Minicystis rosea]